MDEQTKRARFHALLAHYGEGGSLDPGTRSARQLVDLPDADAAVWRDLERETLADLLMNAEQMATVPSPERALVVAGGYPGSGKTSAIARLPVATTACRANTDGVVEQLLRKLRHGDPTQGRRPRLTGLEKIELPGGPLTPLEVAPFLYAPATRIRDRFRRDAIRHGHSLVFDGTGTNPSLPATLVEELRQAPDDPTYDRIIGIVVECDEELAARSRYQRYCRDLDDNELGGRLVLAPAAGPGLCDPRENIEHFVSLAQDLGYATTFEVARRHPADGGIAETTRRATPAREPFARFPGGFAPLRDSGRS